MSACIARVRTHRPPRIKMQKATRFVAAMLELRPQKQAEENGCARVFYNAAVEIHETITKGVYHETTELKALGRVFQRRLAVIRQSRS